MRIAEKRKVNILKMKCLRSLVGVVQRGSVRNEEIQEQEGSRNSLAC